MEFGTYFYALPIEILDSFLDFCLSMPHSVAMFRIANLLLIALKLIIVVLNRPFLHIGQDLRTGCTEVEAM
jgi:hypothetical protein